jgi:glycosyltransferase involved in cell wall biosynthesis
MPTPPRVGIIWCGPSPLVAISVRYERYVRGFRALGCEAFAVCAPGLETGFGEPVITAPDPAAFRDPDYWRSLRLNVAVLVTWLGLPDVVGALKRACPWVVSLADSDGQVGVRVHPRATFARSVLQHRDWGTRVRGAKFWLERYFVRPETFDRPGLESAGRADLIAICSPDARDYLGRFFRYYGQPDLAHKVVVVPYPVDDCYLNGPVPQPRRRQLVAVGRWDDPQKDAALLAAAVRRVLAVAPEVSFRVVGPNGGKVFAALCRDHPQVRYLGPRPPEAVAALLRESRSLLLSSRWESGPIVANEALCLGCSLVGPAAIPSLAGFCDRGRYGTACRRRSPRALADAVLKEMRAWDEGRRDPARIASVWRPRFDPRTVCRQLLDPSDMPCD